MTAPAMVSISQAVDRMGGCISRATAYRLAKETGELVPGVPVFKIRGVQKVNVAQLDRFVAGAPLAQSTRTDVRILPVVLPDPLTPESVEQFRRSLAMLTPREPSGLDREAALALLAELQRLQASDRRLTELTAALRGLLAASEQAQA